MDPRVQKTVDLMRANLDKELRLPGIAQAVNLSVWRLCHIFRSDLGISPIHYLRSLRMERAKYLLETSFLSVKEIAHRVGLNDESHFVRDFKMVYGLTPISYRNSFQHGSTHETDPIAKSANE
jgi:transcriptional regulator GlxA family with amidase domain